MEALIPMTFFFCVAAVLILRPITKKLGGLIEAFAQTRTQTRSEEATDARVVAALEHVGRRLDLMEERLDFTERLVGPSRERRFARHSTETPLT